VKAKVKASSISSLDGQIEESETNVFNINFKVEKADKIPMILPETYKESLLVLEGKRRHSYV